MDWLGLLFDADACCGTTGCLYNWRAFLLVALTGAGAFGGWALGSRLDANWGTSFMGVLLALIGGAAGLVIGYMLIRQAVEHRPPDEL